MANRIALVLCFFFIGACSSGGGPNLGPTENRFGKSKFCSNDYVPYPLNVDNPNYPIVRDLARLPALELTLRTSEVYVKWSDPRAVSGSSEVQVDVIEVNNDDKKEYETLCASGLMPGDEFNTLRPGIESIVTDGAGGVQINSIQYDIAYRNDQIIRQRTKKVETVADLTSLFPQGHIRIYERLTGEEVERRKRVRVERNKRKKLEAEGKPLPPEKAQPAELPLRMFDIRVEGVDEDGTPFMQRMILKEKGSPSKKEETDKPAPPEGVPAEPETNPLDQE